MFRVIKSYYPFSILVVVLVSDINSIFHESWYNKYCFTISFVRQRRETLTPNSKRTFCYLIPYSIQFQTRPHLQKLFFSLIAVDHLPFCKISSDLLRLKPHQNDKQQWIRCTEMSTVVSM